jgi:hypothetical protein
MKKRFLLNVILLLAVISLSVAGCTSDKETVKYGINGTLTLFDVSPLTLDPALARSDTSLT